MSKGKEQSSKKKNSYFEVGLIGGVLFTLSLLMLFFKENLAPVLFLVLGSFCLLISIVTCALSFKFRDEKPTFRFELILAGLSLILSGFFFFAFKFQFSFLVVLACVAIWFILRGIFMLTGFFMHIRDSHSVILSCVFIVFGTLILIFLKPVVKFILSFGAYSLGFIGIVMLVLSISAKVRDGQKDKENREKTEMPSEDDDVIQVQAEEINVDKQE